MASVDLTAISVTKDDRRVLSLIDLRVEDGDFLGVVGPSGSGKTTLLRVVAGLQAPSSGRVRIAGLDVTDDEPGGRDVAMVFEENVLMPFATARRNVAFPLEVAGSDRREVDRRVEAEARVLGLQHLLERKPAELSHGYQQLVQTARAMVQVPGVFLMDEPLARVDPHLRALARKELALLQRGYSVTTIWATNDASEAMAMSDRIVVLESGFIRADGTPSGLYESPPNEFVARSLGLPPMSIFDVATDGSGRVELGSLRLRAPVGGGRGIRLGVRAQDVGPAEGGAEAVVESCQFLGDHQIVSLRLGGLNLLMRDVPASLRPGDVVAVRVARAHFFEPGSGAAIAHETYR